MGCGHRKDQSLVVWSRIKMKHPMGDHLPRDRWRLHAQHSTEWKATATENYLLLSSSHPAGTLRATRTARYPPHPGSATRLGCP